MFWAAFRAAPGPPENRTLIDGKELKMFKNIKNFGNCLDFAPDSGCG